MTHSCFEIKPSVTCINCLITSDTRSCADSSFKDSLLNAFAALLKAYCFGTMIIPRLESMDRTLARPRNPPNAPGDAASSAAVLPVKAASAGWFGTGRETQSIVFFSTALIALLYSGQLRMIPWLSIIMARTASALSGTPDFLFKISIVQWQRIISQIDDCDLCTGILRNLCGNIYQFLVIGRFPGTTSECQNFCSHTLITHGVDTVCMILDEIDLSGQKKGLAHEAKAPDPNRGKVMIVF